MTRYLPKRLLVTAALAVFLASPAVLAYPKYDLGCDDCHGRFLDATSPKGSVFPSSDKHEMHRAAAHMASDCGLCHMVDDRGQLAPDPFTGMSAGTPNNRGLGCAGCHVGPGLRAHHAVVGVSVCAQCHQDPAPSPEDAKPPYYGTADTRVTNSCNSAGSAGSEENWTIGDLVGLDNDGDGVYDASDSDCVPEVIPEGEHSLLLRRRDDSRWFSYTFAGSQIAGSGFLNLTRSFAFASVSRDDFDGDGKADLLVRDVTGDRGGRWALWTLDGEEITSAGPVKLTPNLAYGVISTDDFDADGRADVLMRDSGSGRWSLFLMNAQQVKVAAAIADLPRSLAWQPAAVADYNGDGRADILVRHDSGSWLMYLMNGTTVLEVGAPAYVSDPLFSLQTAGDFNGDGRSDVLLRRPNGNWFMYLNNGLDLAGLGKPRLTVNTAWRFVAASDFDGDGADDVLIRNREDGRWSLSLMAGVQPKAAGLVNMSRNRQLVLEETADYNADGKGDVLLRHASPDYEVIRWVLYQFDGLKVLEAAQPEMTKNPVWKPVID